MRGFIPEALVYYNRSADANMCLSHVGWKDSLSQLLVNTTCGVTSLSLHYSLLLHTLCVWWEHQRQHLLDSNTKVVSCYNKVWGFFVGFFHAKRATKSKKRAVTGWGYIIQTAISKMHRKLCHRVQLSGKWGWVNVKYMKQTLHPAENIKKRKLFRIAWAYKSRQRTVNL